MKNRIEKTFNYYKKHKWMQHLLCITLIICILIIVIPFVLSSGYTYLCEDDFSFEGGARDGTEQYGQIKGAFMTAHRYYMTWQGTYFSNFIWHFVRPYLAVIFIITILCDGKVFSKSINHLQMFLVLLGILITQYLTAFPAVLAYQGSLHNARTSATFELIIKITFIFGVICLAQWCKEHVKLFSKLLPILIACTVIFGAVNYNNLITDTKGGYSYTLSKELYHGTIRDVYKVREATLSQIDSAPDGADVVVFANSIPSNKTMYGMGLLDDPNSFVNASAAGLYKVNSVTVIYE